MTAYPVLCYNDSMDAHFPALMSDVELIGAFEEETDPDTRQLLGNELHWRALAFCSAQEVN